MSDRLTGERIAEILAPPDRMGETELQALAREVRELRAAVSSSDEKYIGLLKVERDSALEALNCSRNKVQQLTRERDQHEAEAKRQHELLHHGHLRANNLECTVRNLELGIEQLNRELAEASRTIDLQSRQISHQARQCQEIEDELAASREFNRRFRGLFAAAIFADSDPGKEWIRVCRDYDATQTQQPQPTKTEWVPWTAETRPRGTIWIRIRGDGRYEWAVIEWGPKYFIDSEEDEYTWDDAFKMLEWSRDGITWHRCGVEVAK